MMKARITNKIRFSTVASLCLLALAASGCRETSANKNEAGTSKSDEPMRIYVSIPPLKFAAKAIGGDRVHVSTLLAPGQSPATYEPTPKQMVDLSKSKCLFAVGVPFETQVVSSIAASMPDLPVIDTTINIVRRKATHRHSHAHDASANHEQHAEALDPHVWMNPRHMRSIAERICSELCRLDPDGATLYTKRMSELRHSLDALDSKLTTALGALSNRRFYVYHPSLGYFADAYGLKQVAIERDGKEPTAKELIDLVARARKEGVRLIFVQPQFSQRAANSIAKQIGGAVVALNPLSENYIENLGYIAEQIIQAASGSASANDDPAKARRNAADE
ncbi:MAG: zinc ABC transporter solute-binding protein [Planctomycetes bacterium]|nr:zinc ABC transporter solute-binding protein [Planctomycetota bacterium]